MNRSTYTLDGRALTWALARAMGYPQVSFDATHVYVNDPPVPFAINWGVLGYLIERDQLIVRHDSSPAEWRAAYSHPVYTDEGRNIGHFARRAPDAPTAIARCIVARVFDERIDVPEELQ